MVLYKNTGQIEGPSKQ